MTVHPHDVASAQSANGLQGAVPDHIRRVEDAIAEAESRTSAEIVVVIAARSGRYDRAEDTFGLLCGLGALALGWLLFQQLTPETAEWSGVTTFTLSLGLAPVLLLVAAWAALGALLATRFPVLARPFIPRSQMDAEVRRRGAEAFHMFRIARTEARSGVLVFVSLLEHMVLVTGDDAVRERISEQEWSEIRDQIIGGCRTGNPWNALAVSVRRCGDLLAREFPRSADDADELPNSVCFLGA